MPILNYIGMRPDGSKALRQGETAVSSNFFGQSSFATYLRKQHYELQRRSCRPKSFVLRSSPAPLGCGVQTDGRRP